MEKEMDEGRKRTLGVIAAIFACRKFAALEGASPPPQPDLILESVFCTSTPMLVTVWLVI